MALFYVNVKTFNRSRGQSAVNAAAYRAAQAFVDERTGLTHSYLKKAGVLKVFLTTPPGAAAALLDPETLWNEAERAERRNGRPAREVLLALPAELTSVQSSDLARAIAQHLVDCYRVAAMTCIHGPDRKGDQRNVHAHILITTREVGPNGLGRKTRVLDDRTTGPKEVEAIRTAVARLTNEHLARAGIEARVDHASLKKQSFAAEARGDFATAIRFIRSPMAHEGQAATAAGRRGERSIAAESNSAIRADNASLQKLFILKIRSIAMPMRIHVGGVSWAAGRDGDLLNAQAQSARDTIRMEADVAHAYQQMLADAIRDAGRHGPIILNYAHSRGLDAAATLELARHAKNPGLGVIVQGVLRAEHSSRHLETLETRRRARHLHAVSRTNRAESALHNVEQKTPANKREWAELRRQKHAALEAAKRSEKRALKLISHEAERRVASRAGAAHERAVALEIERRKRFPIRTDALALKRATSAAGAPRPTRAPLDWLNQRSDTRKPTASRRPH